MADRTYNLNGGFKPTMKRFADLGGPDFFPTPRWATFALIDNEAFKGNIWECACGDGAMSRVLEQAVRSVYSSDLYERGYGDHGHDFLNPHRSADNIVTNPPYNCAAQNSQDLGPEAASSASGTTTCRSCLARCRLRAGLALGPQPFECFISRPGCEDFS
jgi:hypothetical protein